MMKTKMKYIITESQYKILVEDYDLRLKRRLTYDNMKEHINGGEINYPTLCDDFEDEFEYASNVIQWAADDFMSSNEDAFPDESYYEIHDIVVEKCKDWFGEYLFNIYRDTCSEYIIKESQLDRAMMNYFDKLFQVDDINFHYPLEYNDDTGEEYEDEYRINYYIGDYEDGDNDIFKWYGCEYFNEGSHARTICPTVDVETKYSDTLNGYFGDRWVEPFKIWFTKNFDDRVKTVEWWGKGD